MVERTLHKAKEVLTLMSLSHALACEGLTNASISLASLLDIVNFVVASGGMLLITLELDGEKSLEFLLKHNLLGVGKAGCHIAELFLAEELIARL